MIHDATLRQLQTVATPKRFLENEYICHEGQPGEEMFIILQGSVGVFLTSSIGTLTEVARIDSGDFFGEMAIFDNLPRSASCIAIEDTMCVAINKENLTKFFANCPDMAVKLVENMSGRIRRLDAELYQSDRFTEMAVVPPLSIPEEYGFSHIFDEPVSDKRLFDDYRQKCPVCGVPITVHNLRKNILTVRRIDSDSRVVYSEVEPLWFDVICCPFCRYTNTVTNFFKIREENRAAIKKVLAEEHVPLIKNNDIVKTPFDKLVLKYLQAIHINEIVNSRDYTLIGMLWMALYWLSLDVADEIFAEYSAKKAMEKFEKAFATDMIANKVSVGSIAMSLSNLHYKYGDKESAQKYCDIALECPEAKIKANAYSFAEQLKK